jgi:hypothetical protein
MFQPIRVMMQWKRSAEIETNEEGKTRRSESLRLMLEKRFPGIVDVCH